MALLKEGSSGADVVKLQQKLIELGFDPGNANGSFDSSTKAAVIAFQQSKGLSLDGKAGKDTLSALGLDLEEGAGSAPATSAPLPVANVTVDIVSKMFPQTPRPNIQTNLPFVLQAMVDAILADKNMILMALSTIRAETASFRPISEGISKFNTAPGGTPFGLYNPPGNIATRIGNTQPGDGPRFKGRGFIQLTGRFNYKKFGPVVGADLIVNPDLGNDPKIAAELLAAFIKDKEQQIRKALAADDLRTARKLVNGGSHGLDDFTAAFRIGQKLIT